ncbi:MAG: hypothetical protein M1356_07350 [Gammaproteobacteria bacterium]|nr:hypothetical protein [Gammaproteobacteria bacterium]
MRKIFFSLFWLNVVTWSFAHAAEPEINGQFVQGGMVVGQAQPGSEVRLNGEALKVAESGHFVFGIGRDDTAPVSGRYRFHPTRRIDTDGRALATVFYDSNADL